MKILLITDLYPIKQGEKATAKTLHNFAKTWLAQGNRVDVIKPNFILNSFLRAKPFYKTDEYEIEGIRVFNVNYFSPFCFDVTRKLTWPLDDYDMVIAHMPSGIIFANKLDLACPMICAVHNSDLKVLSDPLYRLYFRPQMVQAYGRAEKIACRSHVIAQKFAEILPEFSSKIFIANSGVDIPVENRLEAVGVDRILTCANLIKRKNIDKLILAMDLVAGNLQVIGDGVELNRLKRLSKGKKIEFSGRLSQIEVFEKMKKSDIFILPSIDETFGMVYLEAMACGCIVVCTKNDGIDGIIIDGFNGFLTEPSAQEIAKTINKIKSCQNLEEIRKNSIETAKKYNAQACADNYLKNSRSQSQG